MSLFVRLQTNFWTHRKTARLRSSIGEMAYWVPLRLWCYAAENQADGDFSKYGVEELGILIGCSSNAQAVVEALQASGFMDGMQIHGWSDHNGYHQVFADRAKKAAAARWEKDKKRKDKRKRGEERTREEGSNAASMLQAFDEFWKAYPKKVGRGDAEKAWSKKECTKLIPQILVSIRDLKISEDWTKEGGQYIPHPATWLNREGWHDELPKNGNGSSLHSTPSKYGF